jgi:hypothetical protein
MLRIGSVSCSLGSKARGGRQDSTQGKVKGEGGVMTSLPARGELCKKSGPDYQNWIEPNWLHSSSFTQFSHLIWAIVDRATKTAL